MSKLTLKECIEIERSLDKNKKVEMQALFMKTFYFNEASNIEKHQRSLNFTKTQSWLFNHQEYSSRFNNEESI